MNDEGILKYVQRIRLFEGYIILQDVDKFFILDKEWLK